ncbi:MAG TPA: helix-turn-helix domain-containing protein [Acidimicrobiales bacterium]|nr:helix-turn-helix domain-containing protein [Acidimicrobiales bacterium]
MADRKSYRQFCGLARSLDHVGDRWTLLVVRELLLGDRTFHDLQASLDGISPSLLTRRLTELVADGLVERNEAPRRSKGVQYQLTDAGRGLEPVIIELIRWGSRWMLDGPGDDHVDQQWAPLALRALLEGRPSTRGRIHLDVDGVEVTVTGSARGRRVTPGRDGHPDATVKASLPTILAVAADVVPLRSSGAEVSGDGDIATQVLSVGSSSS